MSTTMVVCNIYELLKRGKSFTKEGKVLKRSNSVITRDWAETKNSDWENSGLWFDIDDEKTAEYYKKGELKREKRKEAEDKKNRLTEMASNMLDNASKTVELDDDIDELVALKAQYKEKFGKKAFYKWGIKELTEKLK